MSALSCPQRTNLYKRHLRTLQQWGGREIPITTPSSQATFQITTAPKLFKRGPISYDILHLE
jgi:hypothetical protein